MQEVRRLLAATDDLQRTTQLLFNCRRVGSANRDSVLSLLLRIGATLEALRGVRGIIAAGSNTAVGLRRAAVVAADCAAQMHCGCG